MIPHSINSTFIVLIPKITQANLFEHYRPINMYKFSSKMIFKLITTRLGRFMDWFISLSQEAFVESQWIVENIVMVQELVHMIKIIGVNVI